jgi:FixJ family two-component response regulator
VFVVDDDDSVRRSLARLLRAGGYVAETFGSAREFLASDGPRRSPACLVLDVQLPGMTGMELQVHLRSLGSSLAIVFITGHGDIPTSVRAMKGGAVDFLSKPFDDAQFLEAVAAALERSARDRRERAEVESIQERWARLTPREREVMRLIVSGRMNKEVAAELGTVEKTIKVHRARVMEKMKAASFAALVQQAERAGLCWTKVQ